jgi:hypothetical protein
MLVSPSGDAAADLPPKKKLSTGLIVGGIIAALLTAFLLVLFLVILPNNKKNKEKCSATNLTGTCEVGFTCQEGKCIIPVATCNSLNPTGTCAKSTDICISGVCTPEAACSATVPCIAPNTTCIDGNCMAAPTPLTICDAARPCDVKSTCVNGACMPKAECTDDASCRDSSKKCQLGTCVPIGQDKTRPCTADNPVGTCSGTLVCDNGRCLDQSIASAVLYLESGNRFYQNSYLRSPNKKFYLRQNPDTRLCLYEANANGNLVERRCWGTARTAANSWTQLTTSGNLCAQYATVFDGRATSIDCYFTNTTTNKTGPFFLALSDDGKICIFPGTKGTATGQCISVPILQ